MKIIMMIVQSGIIEDIISIAVDILVIFLIHCDTGDDGDVDLWMCA